MKLTIITKPLFINRFYFQTTIIYIYRLLTNLIKFKLIKFIINELREYGGHYSVTRSLIEGLKNNKIDFNYNPFLFQKVNNVVIVLSDARALKQMIELKKNGKIKTLVAGPNIVEFPFDNNNILCHYLIDMVIVPSKWVSDLYIELKPVLKDKIYIMPAGVDVKFWKVNKKSNKAKHILLYLKGNYDEKLYNLCKQNLKKYEVTITEIKYGKYSLFNYREILKDVDLLIGFPCSSESQCIAWAECWATNTPTLIHSIDTFVHRNIEYKCSSAPYLNEINGLLFKDITDFDLKFNTLIYSNNKKLKIRQWVISNMSDYIITKRIVKKISEI